MGSGGAGAIHRWMDFVHRWKNFPPVDERDSQQGNGTDGKKAMRKLKFGILVKIWAGVSILVAAYLISNVRNLQGLRQIERRIGGVSSVSLPASHRSRAALNYFGQAVKRCDDAAVLGHGPSLEEAKKLFDQASEQLGEIAGMEDFGAKHRKDAADLRVDLESYGREALPLYERMSAGDEDPELMERIAAVGATMQDLQERFSRLNRNIGYGLLADVDGAVEHSRRQIRLNLALFALVMCVSIPLVTYIITHWILRHIRQVVEMANRLAEGDLPERLPGTSLDEIGDLERAFNRTADANRQVVQHVRRLAQGNYEIDLRPRSERDELILSLIRTTEALNRFAEDARRGAWLKGGLGELAERLRGEQALAELCDRALAFVAQYVGADIGATYLAEGTRTLVLGAGVGFRADPAEAQAIRWGEGLAGEAAARQTPFRIDGADEDVLRIRTGLAEIAPRHVAIQPLVYRNETVGVLELGFVRTPGPQAAEFLAMAAEPLAVAIRTAQSSAQVRELLAETQRQSRELRRQQETLRQANAELEERAKLLEQQKQEIRRQNKDLEAAQLDLERKARDLEQASKYKSEFLANMSHELRTPLNSLLILSRLLADNKTGTLTEKQTEYARTIHKSGNDLLTLINDILDLSKVEAGKMEFHFERVDVGLLCRDMQNMFRHLAAEKKLQFGLEIEEGVPTTIRSDGQRLGQVLRNLLSNAFKFTTAGGVTIRVFAPDAAEPGNENLRVGIEVRDTGIGIPENKRAQIFEAFQQADGSTSRKYGGTGLGLSISREFARRLGGRIEVKSEEGKGSSFAILLPPSAPEARGAAAVPAQAPAVAEPAAAVSAGGRPRRTGPFVPDDRDEIAPGDRVVLVVEDDAKFASILVAFAHENGCKAVATDDGGECAELAERFAPFGILLDMMLPGTDGRKVLGLLKERETTRRIPVHVVSALDEDRQTYRLGAIGFLSKPVTPEQLRSVFSQFESYRQGEFRRLLMVEDDAAYAASLKAMLEGLRVETVVAPTGQEALDYLEKERADCILLDLGLPDMSGNEVLERIVLRKDPRHVPLIVHTARDLSWKEESRLRELSDGIVLKGEQSIGRLLDEVALFLHVARAGGCAEGRVEPEAERAPAAPVARAEEGPAAAGPSEPRPPAGPPGELKGRKVLIVDDDMRNAYSLAAILDGEGTSYEIAADGQAALEALRADPRVDLVLMDIMMPGMDGYEAMRRIRAQERFRKLPILALTAKAMAGDREKCIEAGASDYLPKPVDTDKLVAAMRAWLAGG